MVLLKAIFLCVFILGGTLAHDPDLEAYLREAIENFRSQMKEGIPEINLPALEPLLLQDLDVNVHENMATMSLQMRQIMIRCLSTFNVTNLKPDLEEFYLEINLTLPELYANGTYHVNGKMLKIFPIYGQGKFDINATGIKIFGRGQLAFVTDTLQLSLLNLDLTWRELSVFMENFLGGGNFAEVLQRVVTSVGKDVFELYKPVILEKLELAITDKVNKEMQNPLVKDIVAGIFSNHHSNEMF